MVDNSAPYNYIATLHMKVDIFNLLFWNGARLFCIATTENIRGGTIYNAHVHIEVCFDHVDNF